jgi:glutathione S-transferase
VITLYLDGYFVNQWDATCYIALTEKQLPFATARALLRDGQGVPAALRDRTSTARVPAVQHGDVWLTESSAIVEYLEEVFPGPEHPRLLPADLRARARARQLMSWLRFELGELREQRPWWMTLYKNTRGELPPLTVGAQRNVADILDLATRLHAAGELAEWHIGHVDLALTLMRLADCDTPLSEPLCSWFVDAVARPSVRAYLDHPRPPNPPPASAGRG